MKNLLNRKLTAGQREDAIGYAYSEGEKHFEDFNGPLTYSMLKQGLTWAFYDAKLVEAPKIDYSKMSAKERRGYAMDSLSLEYNHKTRNYEKF